MILFLHYSDSQPAHDFANLHGRNVGRTVNQPPPHRWIEREIYAANQKLGLLRHRHGLGHKLEVVSFNQPRGPRFEPPLAVYWGSSSHSVGRSTVRPYSEQRPEVGRQYCAAVQPHRANRSWQSRVESPYSPAGRGQPSRRRRHFAPRLLLDPWPRAKTPRTCWQHWSLCPRLQACDFEASSTPSRKLP